ncbi:MAG: hypothetical protein M1815_000268 [Lichina confinis]|nr:MAG: hypothetical protein M1815_000268 [Lichina confinis]
MKLTLVITVLAVAFMGRPALASLRNSVPECLVKCWDKSVPITACSEDIKCLCEDTDFPDCSTAYHARAIHDSLVKCSKYGHEQMDSSAKFGRRDHAQMQRRYAAYGPDSPHHPAAATQSVRRCHLTPTTTAHVRPTPKALRGSGYESHAQPTPV